MNIFLTLLFLALIGALIGWITNKVAIKLLFRPVEPFKIPLLPFTLQGVIPKRKKDISKSIGEIVAVELISVDEIIGGFVDDMDTTQIIEVIKARVILLANEKMPAIIPSIFKGAIVNAVSEMIDENGEQIMNELVDNIRHKADEKIDIAKMVEDKINEFDFMKLEEIIFKIAKNELSHIEVLGGVIGFFIGIVQGLIMLAIM